MVLLTDQEALLWFEKDWDEDNISSHSDEDDEQEQLVRVVTRRRRKCRVTSTTPDDDTGVTYSIDIWFLIGEFVDPEDVSRFALICQGAHLVTHSSRFWANLYRR